MKFRLVFRGSLPPEKRGTAEAKQAIRRQMHPQLRTLWNHHPALADGRENLSGKSRLERIADGYSRCGFRFVPLIRKHLVCSLDMLVLRRDEPYQVLSAGDLDNLVKTLIDGLRMPQQCTELGAHKPEADEDPFFCLLEDDRYVIEFNATTDRLLVPPEPREPTRDVYAVITVTVSGPGGGVFYAPAMT